jgi:uncharacterized protein (TIGR03435 family)
MKNVRLLSILSVLALSFAPMAQTATAPSFEVASIKSNNASGNFVEVTPGTLTVHSGTLATCITWAYDVQYSQVTGADSTVSNFLNSERYDIVAKSAGLVPESQLRLMLQALLAERFKLTLQRQSKELQVYTLMVAKNGPKLRESERDAESKQQAKSKLIRQWTGTKMAQFALDISGAMGAPVLDQTGLSAKYDFSMDLTPYLPPDLQPGQRPDMASMVITAIHDELGLRLESRKAPMEVLVIDHAEKPSEN